VTCGCPIAARASEYFDAAVAAKLSSIWKIRSVEAGQEVGINDAQSGERAFFLDAHLSRSFRVISGTGLSDPHNRIAKN
jgi:hypothetical protein